MDRNGDLIEVDQLDDWEDNEDENEDEDATCPECGEPLAPEETVCPNCGAEFGFFCPECDREIPPEADVCPFCGAELAEGFEDEDETHEPAVAVAVSYTHLRAHETPEHLVCRLLLEKKKKQQKYTNLQTNRTLTHRETQEEH